MNRAPPKQSSDSFWLTQAKFENVKTMDPITAELDVIIIGGGISGVSAAYFLKKYGVPNALLLESRGIASGATGRNGGHLWSKPPTLDRFKQFGMEQVKKMIDFETETVELVVDFITSNNVSCDFRRCGSVSLTSKDEEALEMKHTIELLRQLPGFKDLPVDYLDAEQIQRFTHGSTAYKGGILSKNAGQLWPAKLIFFVIQKAMDLGLHVWTQTTVTQVRKEKNIYVVTATRDGKTVQFRTKSVVYATNGYADGLLPQLKDIIVPVRGQAIVTSPIKPIIPHNLSMNDGYEYMIHREDGRIVLGGMRWKSKNDMERNSTDDSQISQDVSKGLRDMLPEKFPYLKQHKYTIEQEWTGIMGFSTDENPLIGAISPVERVTVDRTRTGGVMSGEYILAGYTGYGMPICFGAGKAVAEMVIGLIDPFKFIEAYSPQRYEVFRKSVQQSLKSKL